MSEQTEQAQVAENTENSDADHKPREITIVDPSAQKVTPIKKVKSKKDLKNDPSRFEMPGVNFNAKLIGVDDVENARGDKMCQESMHKLKIGVKTAGQHKQKIVINVSLDGIRIIDQRTQTVIHSHPVYRISFISRDLTDGRAFGYVFGAGEGKHKFFAIKTEKAAEALVLTLRDLFQVVYDLKKKEVEVAKTKAEEKAVEAKEEPAPNKEATEENSTAPAEEPTYQVPTNNAPVRKQSNNLLMLETEMEAIEKRIEEINTMDELFKELETPPVTSAPSSSSSASSSWSNDLAGLSSAPTQPTFSIGGGAFPGQPQQGFPPQGAQNQFWGQQQPAGNPPGMGNAPFGQPATSNPFQAFPPSPGMRPQQGGFPAQQQPVQGFPGTPFPGFQQPGFPPVPQRGGPSPQPVINVQAPSDPFGNDPFQTESSPFEEGILTPAKLETEQAEQPVQKPKKDAFDDLVNIGVKTETTKSPKDLFVQRSTPAKTSLNEMKGGNRTPSPKPTSPFGNQASQDDPSPPESNVAWTSNPFSDDPFANDPFASASHTYATIAPRSDNVKTSSRKETPSTQSFTNQSVLQAGDVFGDDDFNLPSPEGPPPPLPVNVLNQSITIESHICPEPPPRPLVNTHQTPPLPPRPSSAHSDSVKNRTSSVSDSPSVKHQQTPPLPPRPRSNLSAIAVPRPKPRTSSNTDVHQTKKLGSVSSGSQNSVEDNGVSLVNNMKLDQNANTKMFNSTVKRNNDIKKESDKSNNSWTPSVSSPKIADPFVSTDPFATNDPFTESDPFSSDPFSSDPFTEPGFSSKTQTPSSNDPFTTVVASPKPTTDTSDPFSVFDKTFNSDGYKFDRSSSKKVKLKGAAQ